ncbi:MAG: orotidine-5'-phosphate decarboxylase [Clostridiaceae bacterium]|nr:orotidine-5'-phosphate decarboxylase [Clostridiaceae bacterium]
MHIDKLIDSIKQKQNPTVVGLDPKLEYVPDFILNNSFDKFGKSLEGAADAIWEFNKALIDQLYDIVPAVKPQSAYYEMYGWQGVQAFFKTIQYAKQKGLFVIADVKRNDIGSTAAAYATAYLGFTDVAGQKIAVFDADAATVNAYLGLDGVQPFLEHNKTIFVLVKTSNPSSGQLQDLAFGDKTLYQNVAELIKDWGSNYVGKYGFSNVGAVIGATYPQQLETLRKSMPNTFFLVPGFGAQGAGADEIIGAFNTNGLGAIINSSRSIICAYKNKNCMQQDFAMAAREEAIKMRDDIIKALGGGTL